MKRQPMFREFRITTCTNCYAVMKGYHVKCPYCGHEPSRSCHNKHCTNNVNGDVGTKCDTCKTAVKPDITEMQGFINEGFEAYNKGIDSIYNHYDGVDAEWWLEGWEDAKSKDVKG